MSEKAQAVLLCVSGPKTEEMFRGMVREWQDVPVEVERSSSSAWKIMQEIAYRIVVVISPLADGAGYDLAQMAAGTSAGVIFVCRQDKYAAACARLEASGVYVFSTSMGRQLFLQALRMMDAVHVRLSKGAPQEQMLKDKLRDVRLINRAKCLLIQYEQLTEEQAHKTIERQAMNRRLSRSQVAQEILDSYEM